MADLAAGWSEVEQIAQADADAWAVLLRHHPAVGVIQEREYGRIVVTARLDRGAEEHRMAVYQAMLNFNALALETGCLRLGLIGPGLEIEISAELRIDGVGADDLRFALAHVAAVAERWRAFVADPGDDALSAVLADDRMPGVIRV
jgi:hypothetical protein